MMLKKNVIKLFSATILGLSLILPSFAFALEDEGFNLGELQEIEAQTQGGGGILSGLDSIFGLISGETRANSVPIAKVQDTPGTFRDMVDKAAWSVAKLLVHRITQDIVNLIRTGGQGGTPLFVQDWQGFLLDAADQASGVFLKELKLTQLCEPFGPRLRLIFAGGRRPLQERFRCTVSAIAGNLQNFFNDFNNGGWQRWIELTQVNNNPYGQYLGLLEEKEKREAIAAQAKLNEAVSGSGFLGIEDCEKVDLRTTDVDDINIVGEETPESVTVERCKTVSPGKYLENRLAKATNSDIEQLNIADSFNEIMIAAFQSLINGIFFSPGGLYSSNIYSTTITNQLQEELDSLKRSGIQLSGIDPAINVTQSIINKKENSLAQTKDEIKTLGDLKTCKLNHNKPIAAVDNRIQVATTTKAALEGDIVEQVILLELLKDDRVALLLTKTVEEFNAALNKINGDVAKVGSLAAAVSQNEQIAADKAKAEEDLQNCLNPPQSED